MTPAALTLWQPWAWAIFHAGKDVENRTWAAPSALIGRRILIHAAKRIDHPSAWAAVQDISGLWPPGKNEIPRGAIVGSVILTIVVTSFRHSNPWFSGPVGWKLADPIALATPVRCSGHQGLWRPEPEVVAACGECLP